MPPAPIPEISAPALAEKLRGPQPPLVIDVREANEYACCHLAAAQLRPLGKIALWHKEFDPHAEIVLLCHSGFRSMQAAYYLRQQGFQNVSNLRGGIDAWAVQVDPTMPRY